MIDGSDADDGCTAISHPDRLPGESRRVSAGEGTAYRKQCTATVHEFDVDGTLGSV